MIQLSKKMDQFKSINNRNLTGEMEEMTTTWMKKIIQMTMMIFIDKL